VLIETRELGRAEIDGLEIVLYPILIISNQIELGAKRKAEFWGIWQE
jgi:hypothetical protein